MALLYPEPSLELLHFTDTLAGFRSEMGSSGWGPGLCGPGEGLGVTCGPTYVEFEVRRGGGIFKCRMLWASKKEMLTHQQMADKITMHGLIKHKAHT